MSGSGSNPYTTLDLGGMTAEFRELIRGPFESDEYRRAMIMLLQEQNQLLARIAPRVGGDLTRVGEDPTTGGGVGGGGRGPLSVDGFEIRETSDLDASNDDGTVTLTPGDGPVALVEHEAMGDGLSLLAVGATDATDVEFGVRVDRSEIVGGRTESPLGLITEPFSFISFLGAPLPANNTLEYVAWYDEASAGGAVDLAARLFVEEPE